MHGGCRAISGVCMGTHADCSILSIPFGPSVVFTRSPTAIAPTNADNPIHHTSCQFHIPLISPPLIGLDLNVLAFSPLSSVTSSPKICVGLLYRPVSKLDTGVNFGKIRTLTIAVGYLVLYGGVSKYFGEAQRRNSTVGT